MRILSYSESWFIALIGINLLMGLRRYWIRAGLATCVAGMFRAMGVPLGLAWVRLHGVPARGGSG